MEKHDKMLLVGGDLATPEAIAYCKQLGVHTIMTNHIPLAENPYKQMADEAWEIPVEKLDLLEEKCREVGVTAVFAGVNERNLDAAKELAARLGLPFYASEEGWACARDKGRFKEHCIAVGLDVPKRYPVQLPITAEMMEQINFPVIVKPVDASAQRGFAVCRSAEELPAAYENALKFSASGDIIVEDYIEGIEIGIAYCLINQKPIIHAFSACYPIYLNNRSTLCMLTASVPHWEEFERKHEQQMNALFTRIGAKHGSMNIQAMYKDGKYYLIELGYRLDGVGSWRSYKAQTGYSPLELHVDVQLGRDESHWIPTVGVKHPPYVITAYHLYSKPGKIVKIVGLEDLKKMPGVAIHFERFHEGDEVVASGNMYQAAYFIFMTAKNAAGTGERIQEVNETIHFYDEDGNDMLAYFEDYAVFQ